MYNKELLEIMIKNKVDLNIKNGDGNTVLIYLCKK